MREMGRHGAKQASGGALGLVVALGLAFTLLNAIKPLHIDDTFILRVAQQIVAHPLDPYGFDIFWLQWPQPVHEELTPPLLPYWWAAGLSLFGGSPMVWKLWLVPFGVLLAGSCYTLFRRFARGLELPLTALTLFSPVFLPSFNLMQDVPATALALTALAIFLRASDEDSMAWAALAGLVAGLATQTKYTAVSVLAAMLLWSVLRRRLRPGLFAVSIAVTIFFAWEWAMTAVYGQGMFFGQVAHGLFWVPRWAMSWHLLRLLGATAPALVVLAIPNRGRFGALAWLLAALIAGGFLGLALAPVETPLFGALGVWWVVALLSAVVVVLRSADGEPPAWPLKLSSSGLFLVGWLFVELAVYFLASPFPAVRRIMGLYVISSLLCARSANLLRRPGGGARDVAAALSLGLALGGLYFVVDLQEARAQRTAVEQAETVVAGAGEGGKVWFLGHWGFQYYAESRGFEAVVPDLSRMARGDWLVVPEPLDRQEIRLTAADAAQVALFEVTTQPPLATGYGFYGGSSPLSHRPGPRLRTRIYRLSRDVTPESSWTALRLADWALTAGGRTAAAAVPALVRILARGSDEDRALAARGLAQIGPLAGAASVALAGALDDREPAVRYWAVVALGRMADSVPEARGRLRRALEDPDSRVRQAAQEALATVGDGTPDVTIP